MSNLNNEQLRAVSSLYAQSDKFRTMVNRFINEEAEVALKRAEVLKNFVSSDEKPTKSTSKKDGKRPGRPRGSKNKPKVVLPDQQTNGDSTETKVTHASAIAHVLASTPGKTLSSTELDEALQAVSLPGYTAPSRATLLTILSSLKTKNRIKVTGTKPHSRYALV